MLLALAWLWTLAAGLGTDPVSLVAETASAMAAILALLLWELGLFTP